MCSCFRKVILCLCLSIMFACQSIAQKSTDSELLGRALEYFSGGKYHEALLIFSKLDSKYGLNPRFHAYMGVCCYYEWEYEKACEYFDKAIPQLDAYAPHERSLYYHMAAESHFSLNEYDDAIPLYERQLTVCYDNEKADAYYRLGFCYMFKEDWYNALDYFTSALSYYERFRNTPDLTARIIQLKKMIKGCKEHK